MRFLTLLVLAAAVTPIQAQPKTRVEPVTDNYHGVGITDPYRWLEDDRSPATRAWIDEQTRYTRAMLDPLPGRTEIRQRLTALMRIDQLGLPIERGRYLFFSRRNAAENRSSLYLGTASGIERVIDPARISADETTSVTLLDVSPDGKRFAYGIREGGADELTIRFYDVEARLDLPETLPKDKYTSVHLLPSHRSLYYSKLTADGPRLYHHHYGKPAAEDEVVFGERYSAEYFIGPILSSDGRYLAINVAEGSAGSKTEVFVTDVSKAGSPIIRIETDPNARNFAAVSGRDLYVLTTSGAPNGRVYRVPVERPQRHFWRLVIPEGLNKLENFEFFGDRLAALHSANATNRLTLLTRDGTLIRELTLPAPGSVFGTSSSPEASRMFVQFTSFAYPSTILEFGTEAAVPAVWAKPEIPVDPAAIETAQVWCTSRDGTRVPMFVVKRKDTPMDGNRPTFLTAYGGFGVPMTPYFDPAAIVWLERGGVLAMPNLRGGGEFGEGWHQAGMFERKQNVFDDFIAASEWLIANKYTNPKRLAIEGGSNGGLLVGAALIQRPELYRAVVCAVPLLDMLRYQKFLVARLWVPEYGSAEDPKQFAYLRKYSPYHNVKPGTPYPAVLLVTGDSDTRVAPLHARKMTALLQAATGSKLPVLLHYDTKAGHAGGTPVNKQIDDSTDILSFLFWQMTGGGT